MRVLCLDCGLKMIERCPDEWPEGCRGRMKTATRIDRWRAWTLQRVIERWNRRVPSSQEIVRKVMTGVAETAYSCLLASRKDAPVMKSELIAAQQRLENLEEILRLLTEGETGHENAD